MEKETKRALSVVFIAVAVGSSFAIGYNRGLNMGTNKAWSCATSVAAYSISDALEMMEEKKYDRAREKLLKYLEESDRLHYIKKSNNH